MYGPSGGCKTYHNLSKDANPCPLKSILHRPQSDLYDLRYGHQHTALDNNPDDADVGLVIHLSTGVHEVNDSGDDETCRPEVGEKSEGEESVCGLDDDGDGSEGLADLEPGLVVY